jgi:hypothetical protein
MSKREWLQLDLQHFNDGGGFDLESFRQDFESNYEEPEEKEEPMEEEVSITETEELEAETDTEEEESEEGDELETEDESEEDNEEEDSEESTYVPPAKQTKEENAAFAKLRREKEELAAQAATLKQVADQYGMSVEEFSKAYQEDLLAKQAKEQNVPVEFFKKFSETEQRLLTIEKQAANDKFNTEVEAVKTKYGLDDAEIGKVYDYIGTQGLHDARLGLPTIPFEAAYKALNFDNMMERKTTEAKQKMLSDKKKRQKSSAKAHTNTNASTQKSDEVTDEFVFNRLKGLNLI